jgi:rubrerythrin
MLSQIPVNFEKVKKEELDKEILRAAIIAELDAINLYEQMAVMAQEEDIKKVLLDVAKEEKTHVGEFQTMLLRLDKEQVEELEEGRKEVEEITKKKV